MGSIYNVFIYKVKIMKKQITTIQNSVTLYLPGYRLFCSMASSFSSITQINYH